MDEAKDFQPPYNISWATFLSVLERMAADPPNRVDRSYLDSQSGTIQTYLIAAYKAFGLLSEDGRPTEAVNGFADADRRKEMVADLFRACYPTIVPLGETNSTAGELSDAFAAAFETITGESRRKAIRFFLAGAAYADLKLSPLWKAPKAPRGSSAARRPRRGNGGSAPAAGTPAPAPAKPKVASVEEMRREYFDLLIGKARDANSDDSDLLDRIERLVGVVGGDADKNTTTASGTEATS
jgi:Family of unknown function (DUF5343)